MDEIMKTHFKTSANQRAKLEHDLNRWLQAGTGNTLSTGDDDIPAGYFRCSCNALLSLDRAPQNMPTHVRSFNHFRRTAELERDLNRRLQATTRNTLSSRDDTTASGSQDPTAGSEPEPTQSDGPAPPPNPSPQSPSAPSVSEATALQTHRYPEDPSETEPTSATQSFSSEAPYSTPSITPESDQVYESPAMDPHSSIASQAAPSGLPTTGVEIQAAQASISSTLGHIASGNVSGNGSVILWSGNVITVPASSLAITSLSATSLGQMWFTSNLLNGAGQRAHGPAEHDPEQLRPAHALAMSGVSTSAIRAACGVSLTKVLFPKKWKRARRLTKRIGAVTAVLGLLPMVLDAAQRRQ